MPQLKDQELSNNLDCMNQNLVIHIVKAIANKVVIPMDQVGASSSMSFDLAASNKITHVETRIS